MEKPSDELSNQPLKSRMMPRKERDRGASVSPRRNPQRKPKVDQLSEASSVRKEKLQTERLGTHGVKMGQETEVKLKSTVVDIDSVRDEVKDENVGLLEVAEQEDYLKHKNLGVCEWLVMVFVLALVLLFLPFSIWFCVKLRLEQIHKDCLTEGCHADSQVVREHERAVIFRLGHLLRGRPRGPGLLFYLPLLDVCHKVDIRLKMLKVPPHVVVTKDLVRPELSVVCYYQIENVALCSSAVSSLTTVLQSLVQAAVRDVLAQQTFSHVLLHRRRIGEQIQTTVDSFACRWGIKVERADIDELSFPVELQQRLAAEAEVKRQQQIKVKAAESEMAAWDGFRASLRHLQPALVLPFPPNLNSDLSSLPPPPPPGVEGDGGVTPGEPDTDSQMM